MTNVKTLPKNVFFKSVIQEMEDNRKRSIQDYLNEKRTLRDKFEIQTKTKEIIIENFA